jgi:hypothetical protein
MAAQHLNTIRKSIAISIFLLLFGLEQAPADQHDRHIQERRNGLQKVSTYMAAGDYRRALEECQRSLESDPSVGRYVYLTYVYQAIEAYLTVLDQSEQWLAVEHLYLNLAHREAQDLIDPPGGLARMAKETIQASVRQQGDLSAAMATRLNREETVRLWAQQTRWRTDHPRDWWFGIPDAWLDEQTGRAPQIGGLP